MRANGEFSLNHQLIKCHRGNQYANADGGGNEKAIEIAISGEYLELAGVQLSLGEPPWSLTLH